MAAGLFRHGIFRGGFILHAILNLLKDISHPHAASRPLVGASCGQDCCQLFSIPAKNVASCKQRSQVYLEYSNEKRTITKSPITDSDGNISLFHLLWKSTTDKTFCQFCSMFIAHSGLKITWEILLPSAVHLQERLTVSQAVPEPGQQSVRQKHTVWVFCQWQTRPQAVGTPLSEY